MPLLRLFGPAREAAGASAEEIPGGCVHEVVEAASRRYGDCFSELLPGCRVWVNGEPAGPDTTLSAGDEVAVLPPVSGG